MSKRASFARNAAVGALAPLFALCLSLAPVQAHAVTFTEVGDAGETLSTAEGTTRGTYPGRPLTHIFGALGSSTDADLFLITITDPLAFSATTVNFRTHVDTQIFLLTLAGTPIYLNDDAPGGKSLQSTLPLGNAFGPTVGGTYVLGISVSGYDPVNIVNQSLFEPVGQSVLSTDVRGPSSLLQPATFAGFFASGLSDSGSYDIRLTGALSAVSAVPEMGTAWLAALGLAGVVLGGRRRHRAAALAAVSNMRPARGGRSLASI